MKTVLADGRLTQRGVGAAPTDHICTPRPAGVGNGGGQRVRQGSTSPGQYQSGPPPPWLHSYTIRGGIFNANKKLSPLKF